MESSEKTEKVERESSRLRDVVAEVEAVGSAF
jgi:hypothetical protein